MKGCQQESFHGLAVPEPRRQWHPQHCPIGSFFRPQSPPFMVSPWITSSALSRVFSTPLASRAGSGVKGGSTFFVEPFISTLDAADGSPPWSLYEARASSLPRIPLRLSTKAQLLRILRRVFDFDSTSHVFDRQLQTIIRSPNSPFSFARGGRALNQVLDGVASTIGLVGLPCMRAGGTSCAASRIFQYSRTANFRAMATFATPLLPRRNFNRSQFRRNSGSNLEAVWAASVSKQRIIELPCLLIAPSRCRPPVLSSLGFNPR